MGAIKLAMAADGMLKHVYSDTYSTVAIILAIGNGYNTIIH